LRERVQPPLIEASDNAPPRLFLLAHGKHRAPHAGHAQEEEPFLGIGEVGDVAEPGSGGGEVERRARDEEALGPGEAFERMPSASRTRLRPPSAPISQSALISLVPFIVHVTEAASWRTSVTAQPNSMRALARGARRAPGSACTARTAPGRDGGLVGDHAEVELRHPSGAVAVLQPRRDAPISIRRCVAPRRASMSSVGGWKVEARRFSGRRGSASSTLTARRHGETFAAQRPTARHRDQTMNHDPS
jgi:hypothetical protein